MAKKKSTEPKNPHLKEIAQLKTPRCPLKYSCLAKPFYYTGTHVPRYSATITLDEKNKEHKAFLTEIEKLAAKNNIDSIGYLENKTINLKFQGPKLPEILVQKLSEKKPTPQKLECDFPSYGWEAEIEFEVKIYFNKLNGKSAFTFPPSKITIYESTQTEEENENIEDSSPGPRSPAKRVRNFKLRPTKKPSVGKQLRDRKGSS